MSGTPLLFHVKIDPFTGEWHGHSNKIPVRVKGDDNKELVRFISDEINKIMQEQRKNGTLEDWLREREWTLPDEPITAETVFDCPYQTRRISP